MLGEIVYDVLSAESMRQRAKRARQLLADATDYLDALINDAEDAADRGAFEIYDTVSSDFFDECGEPVVDRLRNAGYVVSWTDVKSLTLGSAVEIRVSWED